MELTEIDIKRFSRVWYVDGLFLPEPVVGYSKRPRGRGYHILLRFPTTPFAHEPGQIVEISARHEFAGRGDLRATAKHIGGEIFQIRSFLEGEQADWARALDSLPIAESSDVKSAVWGTSPWN